uniref:carbohydrate ABC transporter permease n=1 Tax=Pseudomonas viridiflava TaxID=33069 RepID=UPI003D663A32
VWHWTSLVALLSYSGLRAIPDVYYQAARIDRASSWAIFRHIQLPKMKSVLLIAVMLRFMDSFMIYTEPFVLTGGGAHASEVLTAAGIDPTARGEAIGYPTSA